MSKGTIGFALCGSFCTFDQVIPVIKTLREEGYEIYPIMSQMAYSTDTRFGKAEDYIQTIEDICLKRVISTVQEAEPIGPNKLLDALIIAPCTGNTLGKLACGITDTSVTMAAKAHLRNARPLIIALSTNDALSASAKNIGLLLNVKNIYFTPMKQDNPFLKNTSVIADFNQIPQALSEALQQRQIQPILL